MVANAPHLLFVWSGQYHSHSIVAGGFGVMSQTTRLTPFTLVAIFSATAVMNLKGSSTIPAFTNCEVAMARSAV